MKLQQNLSERERLINLIHACNDKDAKRQWIIELSNSDIECSESQCDGCPIIEDCIETLESCDVYDNERCGGCSYGK